MLFKHSDEAQVRWCEFWMLFCLLKVTGYLKTFIKVMANVKLVFCGDIEAQQFEKQLQVYVNNEGKLYIELDDIDASCYSCQYTVLDKSTAIKFSKELRRQIALMD
jgi:hypothetical protein